MLELGFGVHRCFHGAIPELSIAVVFAGRQRWAPAAGLAAEALARGHDDRPRHCNTVWIWVGFQWTRQRLLRSRQVGSSSCATGEISRLRRLSPTCVLDPPVSRLLASGLNLPAGSDRQV